MKLSPRLEAYRVHEPYSPPFVTWGAFDMPGPCGERLRILAADDSDPITEGWEHVSVSTRRRNPNWEEMCFVKSLFWAADECVMQLHPPESSYVNNHPRCLHLWRPTRQAVPMPPAILVGIKSIGTLKNVAEARAVQPLIDQAVADADKEREGRE